MVALAAVSSWWQMVSPKPVPPRGSESGEVGMEVAEAFVEKKGSKILGRMSAGMPGARVADDDAGVGVGGGSRESKTLGAAGLVLRRKHRGAGVDDQVHEHLLKLPGIHGNHKHVRNVDRERDPILGQIAGETGESFGDGEFDVGGGRFVIPPTAGETQEALGNIGETLSARERLREGLGAKRFVGFVRESDRGVRDHGGKDIVEFVRQDGGHHAQGRQFVLVGEVLLKLVDPLLKERQRLVDRRSVEGRGSGVRSWGQGDSVVRH